MNYIKKLIVDYGKRIDAKEQKKHESEIAIKDIKRKERNDRIKKENGFRKEMRKQINEWYEKMASEFNVCEYYRTRTGIDFDIAVDDIVVLNHYGLRFNSANSWDGGAPCLLARGGCNGDENPAPLLCKITSIGIETLPASDIIDMFFETYSYKQMLSWDNDITAVYQVWLENKRKCYGDREIVGYTKQIIDIYGLYPVVRFDVIDFDFQPNWGLNLFSFLHISCEEGQQTMETWRAVHDCKAKIEELHEKEEELKKNITSAKKKILPLFRD